MFLEDGFATLIEFDLNPSIKLKEKTVTPPGFDGGGPTSTTTMRNTLYRTNAPKHLITLTSNSFTAAYDPAVYSEILNIINKKQIISVTFPDSAIAAFWGWLDKFEPDELTEGEQPTATVTIEPSNENNSGAEVALAMTAATTTSSTTTTTVSDTRLKENLVLIGTVDGLGIYTFNFIGSPVRHVGMMAQEVATKHPKAVIVGGADPHVSPWKINYTKLALQIGIKKMQEIRRLFESSGHQPTVSLG